MDIRCTSPHTDPGKLLTVNIRDRGRWTWVEKDTSGDSYAQTLTRFVAASIRTFRWGGDIYRLPLPETFRKKVGAIFEALESIPPRKQGKKKRSSKSHDSEPVTKLTSEPPELAPELEAAVRRVQEFFFAAVTDTVKESQDDQFKCPVLAYIACYSYNGDDTFKIASQVTSMLAQWQFILRCTALYHGHMSAEADKSTSVIQ
jgi:hypothetical protein